ncbi:MAG: hypothetical protein CR997_12930 [Acidobacteria bacterium]|nr:MAG: hypothetical protein CR997_12930 [Acidobacteriota bacterium]
MMKRVLVLGAGMVAKPFVEEMLNQGFKTTCVDVDLERAQSMLDDHPNANTLGKALSADLRDQETLDQLIQDSDLVTSLLPPPFHPSIAKRCLANKKNLITTSYMSPEMQSMSDEAAKAGLLFLNETGLDPGIDHMTVMTLKDEVLADGGKIVGFQSHCGGFPARKSATNPIRYKFSWNPRGVLGALERDSAYIINNQEFQVPGRDMLSKSQPILIHGEGIYETTPNGNGALYAKKYGLHDCRSVQRGTLRYPGWARFWSFVQENGWLDQEKKIECNGLTPIELFRKLSPWDESQGFMDYLYASKKLQASYFLEVFNSLDFFKEDERLHGSYSAFDFFLEKAQKNWMYGKGEADKVILYNQFEVEKDGATKYWTLLLSQEGIPNGTSAMSLLVGLPCAIGATLMLNGKIDLKGVHISLKKEIYRPILEGLKAKGVRFEKRIHS